MSRSRVLFAPSPDDTLSNDQPKKKDSRKDTAPTHTEEIKRLYSEIKNYRISDNALKDRIRSLEQEVIKLQLENCHLSANAPKAPSQ